ncbi:MAG: hypothetical protein HYV01_00175 [Deltaproteobacteria bacterium]|nr:hypothetical protein [Deltaproteobacteria bacterium]
MDRSVSRRAAGRSALQQKPEELAAAWPRTKVFLLPADFTWPDAATLKAQKTWLREGVEMGMFEKQASGLIDAMYVP